MIIKFLPPGNAKISQRTAAKSVNYLLKRAKEELKPMDRKWYAIYTKSRTEKLVAKELSKSNIEYYMPLHKVLKQWSDRKKWVEEPLFRSYIFVHINLLKDYLKVLQKDHVVCFIKFSGRAVPIPSEELEQVRSIVQSGYQLKTEGIEFSKGDPIKVMQGPLKGLEGELVSFKGKQKVLVKLDFIDKNIMIDIPLGYIQKKIKKIKQSYHRTNNFE